MYRPLLDGQARTNRKLRWSPALLALAAAFLVMGVTVLYSTHHTRIHQQQQGTFAAETAAGEQQQQRRPSPDTRQPLLQQQLRAAQLEVLQLRQVAANVSGILSIAGHQDATTGAASPARAQQLQETLLHPESLTAATAGSLTAEAEAASEAGSVALGDAAGALESHIQAAQGAIHQAIGVLQSAGIQLDVLQQLQLDRLRMKWELYGRGRLQQRRQALAAQLAATRPAAAPTAGKSSSAAMATAAAAAASSKNADAPLQTPEQGGQLSASKAGSTSTRGTQRQQQQQQQQQAQQQQPSRGILIVAGSRQQMANALVSIMVLRQSLNCSLPIEIVHYGAVESDPLMARILATYNASQAGAGSISLVDGRRVAQQLDLAYHSSSWATASSDAGSGTSVMGFAAKAHALAYVTSFQQVLLLDADNLPLINPEELFDSEPFAASGNLFWPDWWHRLWIHPELFRKLGQPVPWDSEPLWKSAESGQVLLDRLRHVDVLEWLWWINAHSNITYAFMHGDKDSYRLAFSLADKLAEHRQVAMPPRGALSFHNASSKEPPFKHQGMVQHMPGRDQKPAFLHRTDHSKFFPNCAALSSTSACHVAFFTSPLTEGQAMLAMEQGMAFPFDKVDLEVYQHECRDDLPVNPDRPDDPARCKGLLEGQNIQPVPLVPIHAFSNVQPLLYSSYLAFKRVKALLDIGERQELEEKQAQQPARVERQQQLQPEWPSVAAGAAAGRAQPIQGRPVSRPKAAGQIQPPQQHLPAEAAAQDEDGRDVSESSSSSSSSSGWTKADADRPAAASSASAAAVGTQLPAAAQSPDIAFQDSTEEHRPLPSAVAALMAASAEPPGDEASAPLLDYHEHEGGAGDGNLLLSDKQQQMLLQRRRAVTARRQQLLQQQRMRLLAPFP